MLDLQCTQLKRTLSKHILKDKETNEIRKPGDWFNPEVYKVNNFDIYTKRKVPTNLLLIINIWNDYVEFDKSYPVNSLIKLIKEHIEELSSFIIQNNYIRDILKNVFKDYYDFECKNRVFVNSIIRKTRDIHGKYKLSDFKK